MFEFLIATGKVGVIGLVAVFVVVFLLAQPGKEISFWGIKFVKKYNLSLLPDSLRASNFKRMPKDLPSDWLVIFGSFINLDKHHIHETRLFEQAFYLVNFSELRTRAICAEMIKFGLLEQVLNYIALTERAFPVIEKFKLEIEKTRDGRGA